MHRADSQGERQGVDRADLACTGLDMTSTYCPPSWITLTPFQVQDVFTNGPAAPPLIALSAETIALDVIDCTRMVPVPMTLSLLALGLAGVGFGRRKKV